MTKKDEAFGFFGQGKMPDDPEVVSLGLARESAKRYYRLWKQLNQEPETPNGQLNQEPETPVTVAPPVVVINEVPLGGVPDGSLFEYGGLTYKRRCEVYSGQVIVLPTHKAHYTDIFSPTGESMYLPSDVIVLPK